MDGNESLGALLYGMFSAISHGTTFGLMSRVSRVSADVPNAPRTPGVSWGAVYASSEEVVTVLAAVILGTRKAYQRRNELFAWASPHWSEAAVRAIQAVKGSLPSAMTE